jgi:hypothetical protein
VPTCDLCDKSTDTFVRIPAATFQQAVQDGFNPFTTPGIKMPSLAPAFGMSDAAAFAGWKKLALSEKSDWGLCAECASAFQKFTEDVENLASADQKLTDTQPTMTTAVTQPTSTKNEAQPGPSKKKFPAWMAVLVLLLLVVLGAMGGYGSGMGRRLSADGTLVTGQLQEQFQLGQEAVKAGQYEVAKQHFEFIIQHNPDFPGVQSAYANLLIQILITPTLTPTLTPTVTSTPDTRSVDEIYNNVISLLSAPGEDLCGRDWNDIIAKLDSLRKADSTYHAAEVDGMYYISLRNRGVCKIYPQSFEPNASCQDLNINLEGGIYDLTMAERFGPLDSSADGLRTWARMFIAGASFWDQDWVQAQNLFAQIMASVPHLADSSCTTATERWRLATIGYAEKLMASGDYCGANQQFKAAFSIDSSKNAAVYPTATAVRNQCVGPSTPKPKKTKTPATTPVATEAPTQAVTP